MELLENVLSQGMVQRLGWMLVHFVWQASAVTLLLAILLRLLCRSSANLRYIVACLALAMVILLPTLTINLIPVTELYSAIEIAPEPEPVTSISIPADVELSANIETLVTETGLPIQSIAASPVISLRQRIPEVLKPTLPFIVMTWLAGVLGLSLWYLGGWAQLHRLKQRMVRPVEQSLRSKLNEVACVLGINRAVQLMESSLVKTPTVIGWLKPTILLPASVLTGFSVDQLEAILAHELAHIKRYDYLVNMLQTVVEILGFYHPAVWWISKKIRVERENCCDDIAVKISGDSIGYAKTLASFDGIKHGQPELAVAASGGSLFDRICRLIQEDSVDIKADWKPSVIAVVVTMALLIPTGLALTARSDETLAAVDTGFGNSMDEHELIEFVLPQNIQARKRLSSLSNKYEYDSSMNHTEKVADNASTYSQDGLFTFLVEQNEAARKKIKTAEYRVRWKANVAVKEGRRFNEGLGNVRLKGLWRFSAQECDASIPTTGWNQKHTPRVVVNDKYLAYWPTTGNGYIYQDDHQAISEMSSEAKMNVASHTTPEMFALNVAFGGERETSFKEMVTLHPGQIKWTSEEVKQANGNDVYLIKRFSPFMNDPEKPDAVWTIDPHRGFLVTQVTYYAKNGNIWVTRQTEPTQIDPGIWFPASYQEHRYGNPTDLEALQNPTSHTEIQFEEIAINLEIPDNCFTLESIMTEEHRASTTLFRKGLDGNTDAYIYREGVYVLRE